MLCEYIYDEEAGDPSHGLAAGTKWEDIPDDWFCPDCGATKVDFEEMQGINANKKVLRKICKIINLTMIKDRV